MRKTIFLLLALPLLGCGRGEKSISVYQSEKRTLNTQEQNMPKHESGQKAVYKWLAPKNWTEKALSTMRIGSYDVPCANEVGDLSISMFAGDAGGLDANINRWRGQLGLEAVSGEEVLSLVRMTAGPLGSIFFSNMEKDGKGFLIAILPLENESMFVKLSASSDGLKAVSAEFENFCMSIYLEQN